MLNAIESRKLSEHQRRTCNRIETRMWVSRVNVMDSMVLVMASDAKFRVIVNITRKRSRNAEARTKSAELNRNPDSQYVNVQLDFNQISLRMAKQFACVSHKPFSEHNPKTLSVTEDLCRSCKFACHKASKCMPPTKGNDYGYTCDRCDPRKGYMGNGFICQDIDECADEELNECDRPNAVCVNKRPVDDDGLKYVCECKPGWRADPHGGYQWRKCKDMNECLEPNACGKNAKCINTPGSYYCSCMDGFTKTPANKTECIDIDECKLQKPCGENANCINTEGSFMCKCKPGFVASTTTNRCKPSNPCMRHNPCAHLGGTECFDDNGIAKCRCKQGFVRPLDDSNNLDKPCFDETTAPVNNCSLCDNATSFCQRIDQNRPFYACRCAQGYKMNAAGKCISLQACVNVNECEQGTANCPPNSRCEDTDPGYTCTCLPGFVNKTMGDKIVCSNINECTDGIGPNSAPACDPFNGICKDTFGSYLCSCKHGFVLHSDGKTCNDPTYCNAEYACPAHASCVNGECACDSGYRWIESDAFPPSVDSLKNRSACKEIDPCAEGQLCQNPLKCRHTGPGLYDCICSDGYEKVPTDQGTCIDIDECNLETDAASCPANSICENLKGSYKCECFVGFTQQIGSSLIDPECVDIDECSAGIDDCSTKNATCINTIGSYECVCAEGYRYEPPDYKICNDIDECHEGTAECDDHAMCTNTMGSYQCDCKDGYFGDGTVCIDIDECLSPLNNDCAKRGGSISMRCVNEEGGYRCVCPPGYFENDNGFCEDIDECNPANRKDSCNATTQLCENLPGSYRCTCKKGYTPVYEGCKDIDECLSPLNNDCAKRGGSISMRCVNEEGGYRCVCPPGYFENDNGFCEDINECKAVPSPCPTTSADLCVNTPGSFKCTCRCGFKKPRNCSESDKCPCMDINECKQGIIMSNGTLRAACAKAAKCFNTLGGYKCICARGYDGDPYIGVSDVCVAANPCDKATQICEQHDKKAMCKCKPGFLAVDKHTCVRNPCGVNKGRAKGKICTSCKSEKYCTAEHMLCMNTDKFFNCTCDLGYKLTTSQKAKGKICTSCKSEKYCTAEHMLCMNTDKFFNCTCDLGYKLTTSQKACININECEEGIGDSFEESSRSLLSLVHKYIFYLEHTAAELIILLSDINECEEGIGANPNNTACDTTAKCVDTDGGYFCDCPRGQIADLNNKCKIDTPKCSRENNCIGDVNAYCAQVDETHRYCRCKAGYEGDALPGGAPCKPRDYCKEINELINGDPCGPNEICVNGDKSYICECKIGFQKPNPGEECKDVNECEFGSSVCRETYQCKNTVGSYECVCPSGYRVNDTSKLCEDIDECNEPSHMCNVPEEHCVNLAGSYRCECNRPAYVQSGEFCVDNDECTTNEYDCPQFSNCVNMIGGYNCTCNRGFRAGALLNGRVSLCEDIDECKEVKNAINECELGIAKCNVHAECIDLTPLYECRCKAPYYTGDGTNQCNRVDLCLYYNDCPNNARCVPLDEKSAPDMVTCKCPKGFVFNNRTRSCDDINECAANNGTGPCTRMPTGAQCINTQGSFLCICPSGYEMNTSGTDCNDIDECHTMASDMCTQTGGICQNVPGSYRCICPEGLRQSIDGTRCIDVDECEEGSDDCDELTTTCFNFYSGFMCLCKQGYGYFAQKMNVCIDINECESGTDNCTTVSETCYNTDGGFYCTCSKGYYEDEWGNCVPKNICDESMQCGTNALCVMRPNERNPNEIEPTCVCKDGYFGNDPKALCEPVYECYTDDQCYTNAHCAKITNKDDVDVHRCICDEGYRKRGSYCEQIDECHEQPNICGKNAICVDLEPHYECFCQPGAINVAQEGEKIRCEPITCKTAVNPCHRDAKCRDIDGGYVCECPPGFVGAGTPNLGCEPVDYCKTHRICSEYATCINGNGTANITCVCNVGFTGDGFTCTDVNECSSNVNMCDENATCINSQGSYTCKCNPGFEGNGLPGTCKDIDECASPILNKCDSFTTKCRNIEGSFECVCQPGFEHAGNNSHACVDVNECAVNRSICEQHHCSNLRGDYRCDCNTGYQNGPDQHTCIDIDECVQNSPCLSNAFCSNTPGSFSCSCPYLYEGDGFTYCNPIDQCKNSTLNMCDPATSLCVMIEGRAAFKCICKQGFKHPVNLNGLYGSCEDIDECEEGIAKFNGMTEECINIIGSYEIRCKVDYCKTHRICSEYATCINGNGTANITCVCNVGFTGDGFTCTDVNECSSNVNMCDENATCINSQGSYTCKCNPGFEGNGLPGTCKDIDECASPILNKCDSFTTKCRNIEGSFECVCQPGFEHAGNNSHACAGQPLIASSLLCFARD
ncbi:Fibrillin-1 [Toxocara canis]|uniref:Fibrillin-1 n=1 Tax=Toxocara canis TaxID=6265 RepID=A0A0B2VE47_TOXCA|nr:Fibrillin-1 [Toxocara canis]